MKKILIVLFIFLLFIPLNKKIKADILTNDCLSSILIEVNSNKVLYKFNEDKRLYPASMTKMMTMLLTMEAIENKLMDFNTIVTVSKYASQIKGSTILLSENEEMSVNDLLKGVAVASGNDAATALAEKIGGSEELFVKKMNDKAKELNLNNTVFKNPTGLSTKGHFSSCYDMAMIGRHLVYKYPKILEYSKIYDDYLRKDSKNPFWLVNTNKLIRSYKGIDGLKTGWTEEAGYCLCATIKKNNMRLLAVIMGAKTADIRNKEMIKLLEYGFTNFEKKSINDKKLYKTLDSILFKEKLNLILDKDIAIIKNKSEEIKDVKLAEEINYNKIKNYEIDNIGKVIVYYNGIKYDEISLHLEKKPQKNNVFNIVLKLFQYIF